MTQLEDGQENDAMMLTANDEEIKKAREALFDDWNANCEK